MFFARIFEQNFGAKNSKAVLYKNRARKTLMKLTPGTEKSSQQYIFHFKVHKVPT
jgi:hypothetical protein